MATITSALFRPVPPTGVASRGGLADFLVPASKTGAVDVLNTYRWTLTDPKGRTETPKATLTEWRLLQSSLINSSRYYTAGLSQQVVNSKNPYLKDMKGYTGLFDFENPTGFYYVFPYFSDTVNEVTNTWNTLDILEKVKNALNTISPAVGGAVESATGVAGLAYEATYPRVGIMDRPKLWESSGFRSINIKFPLYNTVDFADIKKNWDLCYLLMYQNMFNKRDFITAISPVFYTVYIPGQFFTIAAYVSDLKIYNRGNIRSLDIDGSGKKRNVPDVYEIDMTLTDMIMPSQNMLAAILKEEPIQVQNIIRGEAAIAAAESTAFAKRSSQASSTTTPFNRFEGALNRAGISNPSPLTFSPGPARD
jgi:hypothetical protein